MSKRTRIVLFGVACALTVAQTASAAETKPKSEPPEKGTTAAPDSSMHIDAGSQGKNFNSITVEGEDRVRVQFDRPELKLDVDPASAPGLDWESVWTALGAESFDFVDPLL